MPNWNHDTILLLFVAVTGLAVLLQAVLLFAIFMSVRKTSQVVRQGADDLRSSVLPVIYSSRELFTRVAPKIDAAAADLAELVEGLRVQATHLEAAATEITDRVGRQANRVDGMVTSVLNTVDRAGNFVQDAVSVPMRQISGLIAAARAIVESLRTPADPAARPTHGPHGPDDKDLFV